jgi:putative transposase
MKAPLRAPFTQLYVHLIWTTWDRLPLITESIRPRLHAAIATKCRQLRCEPMAIGSVSDHIHLLVSLHPTMCISNLMKEVKGASSHLVTHEITPGDFFKWQGAYRAFTIRKEDVSQVKEYIQSQKQHHTENRLFSHWEPDFEPPELTSTPEKNR